MTNWALENRIPTTTVRALLESVINYGLTLTGSSISIDDLARLDTMVLNPIARRVRGAGYAIRREVLLALADIRSAQNHYLLKVANVVDRVLRAGGTQAQNNGIPEIISSCCGHGCGHGSQIRLRAAKLSPEQRNTPGSMELTRNK